VLAAAVLIAAALFGQRATAPGAVVACSCAPTEVSQFVADPQYVIVSGTVGQLGQMGPTGHQSAPFTLDRVWQGQLPEGRLTIVSGGGGDCTVPLTEGMQYIGVTPAKGPELTPILCIPFGDLRDASGQAVLAQVRGLLGVGRGADAEPPPSSAPPIDLASIALAAVGVIVGLIVLVIVLNVARRRDGIGAPPS
jgi:hypothetical protein